MSLTLQSLAVGVIATLLQGAGVNIIEGDIETTVLTIIQVVGAIGVYYGRFRQGDVNLFGSKK